MPEPALPTFRRAGFVSGSKESGNGQRWTVPQEGFQVVNVYF